MNPGNEMNVIGESERTVLMALGLTRAELIVYRHENLLKGFTSDGFYEVGIMDAPLIVLCHMGLIIPVRQGATLTVWGLSGDGVAWVARELSDRRYSMPLPRVLWDLN